MGNTDQKIIDKTIRQRNEQLNVEMQLIKREANSIGLIPQQMQAISSLSVTQAVAQLNENSLTSKAVVLALAHRAGTIGLRLNLITETNFAWAFKAAVDCDKKRKESGMRNWTMADGEYDSQMFLPPLFGVPISVKDMFDMQGFMTTFGVVAKLNPQNTDSPIIACFKSSGMIPFVRTNVPQLGISNQSVNRIWGRARNPWNEERTPGGSSGGEGGLISAGCSMLGVGSDLGGSVRIPAEYCGICSLKPTSTRISSTYHSHFSKDFQSVENNIALCIGPLARNTEDLALFMKTATTKDFYCGSEDPYTAMIPFDCAQFTSMKTGSKKFKIGFISSLSACQPTVASQRALQTVLNLLKRDGHQVVEVQIPNEKELVVSFFKEGLAVGLEGQSKVLGSEKLIDESRNFFRLANVSPLLRALLELVSQMAMPRLHSYLIQPTRRMSTFEYQTHTGELALQKQKWMKYWKEKELDFLILPGLGSQALTHGNSVDTALAISYTLIWNMLDMVVGALPVTTVRPEEQQYITKHKDATAKALSENAKGSVGLPVGVQVVGAPFSEERVLGLMCRLEEKIKFSDFHPYPKL